MCRRAPFSNCGSHSACYWKGKGGAMVSEAMQGSLVALFNAERNQWTVLGHEKEKEKGRSLRPLSMRDGMRRNDMHLLHFEPVLGTLGLWDREYLYMCGHDYKLQSAELWED